MTKAVIINLPFYNDSFPAIPNHEIQREVFIDTVKRYFESYDVVFVEGDSGSGKTTFLAQFVNAFPLNAVSYFITPSFKYSYDPLSIKESLFKQLYFYVYDNPADVISIEKIDDSFLNSIYSHILRKIKRSDTPLYFVFDGFSDITEQDLNALKPILSQLPWSKAKFIFSGPSESLSGLVPQRIKYKPWGLSFFSLTETKEFLSDLNGSEQELREIYTICRNGLPERLVQIKRLCKEMGGISNFLSNDFTEKTDFFEVEWAKIPLSDTQKQIVSIIAFDETKIDVEKLSALIDIDAALILKQINQISYLDIINNGLVFKSDNFKLFAQSKLSIYKEKVFELLINYYINNPTDQESLFNLPSLYKRAQKWKEILDFLSLDAFVQLIEKTQSLSSVKMQFDYGLEASKKLQNFTSQYLRFALHKSSIKDLEKQETFQSEIEARIALGDLNTATDLANTSLLKEEKIKLYATIAKERKIRKIEDDILILDQIKELYDQIDWKLLKDETINIAGLLLYSFPDLAIELVEKSSENDSASTNLDMAFAYLSFFIVEANRLTKSNVADSDLFSSKITDEETKHFTKGIKFLAEDLDSEKIVEHVNLLKNNSRKLFLLRNWIRNNRKQNGVENVIEFALKTIISTAGEEVPNASALADISSPLAHIENRSTTLKLVQLFDSQRNSITTPTRDYIRWQLNCAEAISQFDFENSKDRLFEIFIIIDEIKDLSIQTDCLCLLWKKLMRIDRNFEIESAIFSKLTVEDVITENLNKLFNETAYHFQLVESIISTLVTKKSDFILEIIAQINTQERRDNAYSLGLKRYLRLPLDKIDFAIIKNFYEKIIEVNTKEKSLIYIIERLLTEEDKEKVIQILPSLKKFISLFWNLNDQERKCYSLPIIIKLLNFNFAENAGLIKRNYKELEKSWNTIDTIPNKIEIGFLIAKSLSDFDKSGGLIYLENASNLKKEYQLTSRAILNTYLTSISICIEAFDGVIKSKPDITEELIEMDGLISKIPSTGEKLKSWCSISLHLLSNKKKDAFDYTVNKYFRPLLSSFSTIHDSNYFDVIADISPVLYYWHSVSFFERLEKIPELHKDWALNKTADFIITKLCNQERDVNRIDGYSLTYEECIDLCGLIKNMKNDYLIYSYIKEISKSLRKHRLPIEQKNDIIGRLTTLINELLPNKESGISHNGYLIISKAELLSCEQFQKQQDWLDLLSEAKAIPNHSDRAFMLTIISEACGNKKQKIEILEEATNVVKTIPFGYDKFNRFDYIWKAAHTIGGNTLFEKIGREAIEDLLLDKDGRKSNIKSLIDTCQQYDSKLSEFIITLADQDPSRKAMQPSLKARMKVNENLKLARTDFTVLKKLSPENIDEVFSKNLIDLNSGRYTSKTIDANILEILNRISELPLITALSAAIFFVRNLIDKYKHNPKQYPLIYDIFKATTENARLIDILSMDSVKKMENRFVIKPIFNPENPIIREGERDKAIHFINYWLIENCKSSIIIIDPYFSEKDLKWVQIIQANKPECQITILCSKEGNMNSNENNEIMYNLQWKAVSSEPAPYTTIQIVWDSNKKSPFHDRWIVCQDSESGLKLGTSFNSLGLKKDAQISQMTSEDVIQLKQTIINDYLIRRVRDYKNGKLYYSSFQLFTD